MINLNLDTEVVEVGGQIAGSCTWIPDLKEQKNPLNLTICWRTEGRGDVDKEIIYETKLKPSEPVLFNVKIPISGPVSYHGLLLKIIWEVGVNCKKESSQEMIHCKAFRVIPKSLR